MRWRNFRVHAEGSRVFELEEVRLLSEVTSAF
jgi:hypothetical protein